MFEKLLEGIYAGLGIAIVIFATLGLVTTVMIVLGIFAKRKKKDSK